MLLEQIKGFYHGITDWLVVIPCLADICKDVYIKTHGSVSCGPRKRGARKRSEYIFSLSMFLFNCITVTVVVI